MSNQTSKIDPAIHATLTAFKEKLSWFDKELEEREKLPKVLATLLDEGRKITELSAECLVDHGALVGASGRFFTAEIALRRVLGENEVQSRRQVETIRNQHLEKLVQDHAEALLKLQDRSIARLERSEAGLYEIARSIEVADVIIRNSIVTVWLGGDDPSQDAAKKRALEVARSAFFHALPYGSTVIAISEIGQAYLLAKVEQREATHRYLLDVEAYIKACSEWCSSVRTFDEFLSALIQPAKEDDAS